MSVYYAQAETIFEFEGSVAAGWRKPGGRLFQGDGFSPLLATVLMRVWRWKLRNHDVRLGAYIDDRLYWAAGKDGPQRIHAATEAAKIVDTALGWKTHPEKRETAANSDEGAANMRHIFNVETQSTIKTLGLVHD